MAALSADELESFANLNVRTSRIYRSEADRGLSGARVMSSHELRGYPPVSRSR